jgi:hypothetical protein
VLAPLDPASALPLPPPLFVAPFEPDPPEQPPAAAIARIAAPARNAGRVPDTTEREVRVVDVTKVMRELYYVHGRGHASTRGGGNLKLHLRRGAAGKWLDVFPADRFDPTKRVSFVTFAYHKIRGAILDGPRRDAGSSSPTSTTFRVADQRGSPTKFLCCFTRTTMVASTAMECRCWSALGGH